MKQWHTTLSCLSSTANQGKVFLFVGCRLTDQKETLFLDLPYHFVCILHRKKEVIDVNLNDHFHAWLHSLGENPMQEAWTSHTLLSPEFL